MYCRQPSCLTCLQIGKGKVVKVTGIHNKGRTATCLLRGSNKLVLEEAERSLHDALCVVRCLVHKKFLIAGGAAPEIELVTQLSKWAKTLQANALPLFGFSLSSTGRCSHNRILMPAHWRICGSYHTAWTHSVHLDMVRLILASTLLVRYKYKGL